MIPSLLLAFLAVLMLFLPRGFLVDWRLGLHGALLVASELTSPPAADRSRPAERDSRERIRVLQERLVQRDAEVARLRQRLAEASRATEALPTLRFVHSQILAIGRSAHPTRFVIDRGSLDGVREASAALQGQSLFGTVARVSARTSLVRTLDATGSMVAARTGRGGELCAVRGDGAGVATVVIYAPISGAEAGEPVLTSGLLGELPADLLIGELTARPEEGAQPGTLEAPVRLHARPHLTEGLLIVRRLDTLDVPGPDSGR